jgi:hypothetical protein
MDILEQPLAKDQRYASEPVLVQQALLGVRVPAKKSLTVRSRGRKTGLTGGLGAHVVGKVTVVELTFVTLNPDSEPLEGVRLRLPFLDADPAADDFDDVVELELGGRGGLLLVLPDADVGFDVADAFSGLDATSRPETLFSSAHERIR